jgi:hypothetical protein
MAEDARILWAGLDLLDRQILDRSERMCGNVDDVEIGEPDEGGAVYVTGIHTGPGALLLRMKRRTLGHWLRHAYAAGPIPIARVADIGAHVTLSLEEEELPTFAGERWMRDHVIGHIPGARDAPG